MGAKKKSVGNFLGRKISASSLALVSSYNFAFLFVLALGRSNLDWTGSSVSHDIFLFLILAGLLFSERTRTEEQSERVHGNGIWPTKFEKLTMKHLLSFLISNGATLDIGNVATVVKQQGSLLGWMGCYGSDAYLFSCLI
jgi:hypothetical protein